MTQDQQRVVERLLAVMGGELEISEFDRILSPTLLLHVEGRTFGGTEGMKAFLTFMRRRISRLTIDCVRTVSHEDGTVSLSGRWIGERGGCRISSGEVSARYRIESGAIAEVWTKRANYEFFFGYLVRSWPAFWLICAWVVVCYRLFPPGLKSVSSSPQSNSDHTG